MDLQRIKLTISENQFDKLRRGHQIQVSSKNLKNGKHALYVNPELAKKVNLARRKNKGVRIQLSRHELEMSAEGLKDFLKKAKKFYDRHIKKHAAPFLKKGLQNLANTALTEAEVIASETPFAPIAVPVLEAAKKRVPQAVSKVGKFTGAFGYYCPHCSKLAGSFRPAGGSFKPAGYP
jgi:hypothetical protein